MTEVVGVEYRSFVGVGYHLMYPVGYIFQSLISYYYRDWHTLMVRTKSRCFCDVRKIFHAVRRINSEKSSEQIIFRHFLPFS